MPVRIRFLAILLASVLLLGAGPRPHASAQAGVRIFEIQGAAHVSPLAGQRVDGVPGVVTALRSNGFYLQDPEGDGRTGDLRCRLRLHPRRSDRGRRRQRPGLRTGARVSAGRRRGQPLDHRDRRCPSSRLSHRRSRCRRRSCSGRPVGPRRHAWWRGRQRRRRGRSLRFHPDLSALDFFESLESMRVQVNDAVAVGRRAGPASCRSCQRTAPGSIDRTVRGGLLAAPPGEAPPRIILADGGVRTPPASLGDRFPGQTIGIVEYAFGGYRVRVDELPPLVLGGSPARARWCCPRRSALRGHLQRPEPECPRESGEAGPPGRDDRRAARRAGPAGAPGAPGRQRRRRRRRRHRWPLGGRTDRGDPARPAARPTSTARCRRPTTRTAASPARTSASAFLFRTDRGLAFVERPGGDAPRPSRSSPTRPVRASP